MNQIYYFLILLSLIPTLISCQSGDKNSPMPENLRCVNLINPDGIDIPSFSWEIVSNKKDIIQTAWEIEIASDKSLLQKGKADVWKSPKQISYSQFGIHPDVDLAESTPYYWRVRIWDNNGKISQWSAPAYFSIGPKTEASWIGKWVTFPYSKERPLPYFRKEFILDDRKSPSKALIYFCGLGAGELYLNNQHIDSTRFLDPAQTNYEQYALYSTFDVTEQIQKGNNCLGVMIGNGWFTQDRGWGGAPFSYGNPMFRLQLVVIYDDGARYLLGSDENWEWKDGPVQQTNIYLGETYDARKEIDGWSMPGLPSDNWQKALLAEKDFPPSLIPQLIAPIRRKEVIPAEKIWRNPEDNWIYDFGVNIAGIPLMEISQPAGTQITIRYAEEIDENGRLDFTSTGWTHHGSIFKDTYTCKGNGKEHWSPRFTYHGCRYAELSGITGEPDPSNLKLITVHTDVEQTGFFECSEPQINHLHEMAIRTVKSNLHGIPTDCPIREKCGWLGDVHAYVKMANLNFRMDNFWGKYLRDIRSGASKEEKNTLFHERYNNTFYFADKPSGIPYMIAPGKRLCGVASPDWGTVVVQLPWWMYVYYGDKQILSDYYPFMKQWNDYVNSLAKNPERTSKYNQSTSSVIYQGLGDWCPPSYPSAKSTSVEFTSTAFHYLDTHIMEQVANLLGKKDDEKKFAKRKTQIANEIVTTMYNPVTKTFGSQTADAMALDLGFVPAGDEAAVADAIVKNMKEFSEGFMDCGIFGLARIGSVLARNGKAEDAWKMFTKKGENSFEWMWKSAKATTLWETLPVNSITQQSAAAGSLNHPMQAGFDVAFFEDIAGIRPDSEGFGFKTIRFQPLFCDYLPWAKATVHTPYGKANSSWRKEGDRFNWLITIPPNTSGLVFLPYTKNIMVNGQPLETMGLSVVKTTDGNTGYRFPSGNFQIESNVEPR